MTLESLELQIHERFVSLGSPRSFATGDIVMRRGDQGDSMMAITSGRVEVSLNTVFGAKSILGVFGPGTLLGDIACLDGRERSADVVALSALEVIRIARSDVLRILEDDPRTAQLVVEALCQKVRNATEILELRVLPTAKARLANALVRLMDSSGEEGRVRVSQSWLGNYSGLTRENVNRQLRAWSKEGVTRFENGEVVISDPNRLMDAALSDGLD